MNSDDRLICLEKLIIGVSITPSSGQSARLGLESFSLGYSSPYVCLCVCVCGREKERRIE